MPLQAQMTNAKARELRAKILTALFVPQPLPALDAKTYGSFAPEPGVIAERVTYATEYGLRVPAIVYRPEKIRGKIPGIVMVNGHGADKTSWYSWYTGVEYARAGAMVVTYDPIGEGERNDDHKDATGEHDKLIDVPGVPQRMGGQMITDVMQGVSYLISRPEVDARRIGVLGFSMGSFVVSLAGAVDPRIHAVLLTGGGDLDGPGGYWDSSHAVMCQSGPYHALEFLGDRPAVLFALQAKRGPTFIINGTNDTVVAIPHTRTGILCRFAKTNDRGEWVNEWGREERLYDLLRRGREPPTGVGDKAGGDVARRESTLCQLEDQSDCGAADDPDR